MYVTSRRTASFFAAGFLAATFLSTIAVSAQSIQGAPGEAGGERWQSSWLDLKPPMSFKKGEKLRLRLEGDAENVMIRLLPSASQPTSSDGVEGGVRKVPAKRILEITLERDHPSVRQISVHSGREAWERPLGGNNGKARLISVDRAK